MEEIHDASADVYVDDEAKRVVVKVSGDNGEEVVALTFTGEQAREFAFAITSASYQMED